MQKIRKGDLVFGTKPWNSFARVGIVISDPLASKRGKCRVFWYAPDLAENKLASKRIFFLDELADSIEKVKIDDRSQNRS